jgi:adenylosuccinate synthase
VAESAKSVVVIGCQWGDEGKGKIVDLMSAEADVVARFQGGNNAGHTLVVDGRQTVLHLIPSGALHPTTACVIGGGVVVDPSALVAELDELARDGFALGPGRLLVSQDCHLILPYHKAIDQARERRRGKGRIGTTGRGIGPAYEDKAARVGLRMADLREGKHFRAQLEGVLEEKNSYLHNILDESVLDFETVAAELERSAGRLRPHITDTARYLYDALAAGRKVLFEGAQGAMLDVDHGTYPFVTSSNTGLGAVCSGAGIPPKLIGKVVGISKAYTTRVGSGPFPTELLDDLGDRLRNEGGEFGATTGRPRRCGWFDAVVVRKAVRVNGVDALALTKLDVLSGIDRLRVCTGYRRRGDTIEDVPALAADLEQVTPVYEEHEGWRTSIEDCRRLEDLPSPARRYVARLEELVGVPVELVSVGADRDRTIRVAPLFP